MEISLSNIYIYLLEAFEELNNLLDRERNILIHNNGEELLKLVEEKRVIIKKISLLEEKRLMLCNNMTMDEIINNGYIDKISLNRMQSICRDIKYKNETNNMLTKQSLHYIRAIKFALTPNENRVTTYGNQGTIGEKTSDSIFSTKL